MAQPSFMPIEIQEANEIEVFYDQTEQSVNIHISKDGTNINTDVIKLTNSQIKKFWTGNQEGPYIEIGETYKGVKENDFYYNLDTEELNLITQVTDVNFMVIKTYPRYIKETDPPTTYTESDFIYKIGDMWINTNNYKIWVLSNIDEQENEIEYFWSMVGIPTNINYETLDNKPCINGVQLIGDKTPSQFGLVKSTTLKNYQKKLIAGDNITIEENGRINANIPSSSVRYNDIQNKPQINNVTLNGNKGLDDLGIQPVLTAGNHIEIDGATISASNIPPELTAGNYIEIDANNRINVTGVQPPTVGYSAGNGIQIEGGSRPRISTKLNDDSRNLLRNSSNGLFFAANQLGSDSDFSYAVEVNIPKYSQIGESIGNESSNIVLFSASAYNAGYDDILLVGENLGTNESTPTGLNLYITTISSSEQFYKLHEFDTSNIMSNTTNSSYYCEFNRKLNNLWSMQKNGYNEVNEEEFSQTKLVKFDDIINRDKIVKVEVATTNSEQKFNASTTFKLYGKKAIY